VSGIAASDWAGLHLKAAQESAWDLVSLGEVMLRFDPGEERISRTRSITSRVDCGGVLGCVLRLLRRSRIIRWGG